MKKVEIVNKRNKVMVVREIDNSPAGMIRTAVAGKASLEQLEKFITLQERYEANEARKAYHQAMADFKVNPPKIEKDKKVSYLNVKYNHASLANVTEKISSALSKCGLSASWITTQSDKLISVTCKITHFRGHSEITMLSAAPDETGSKNSIQAVGSTITYLERYTLLALTGLATYDMDDDGKGATVEYLDTKQINFILDNLTELEAPIKQFLVYMKIESLEKMPKTDYQKALAAIEAKRKQKAGQK